MADSRIINGKKVLNVFINEWEGGANFGYALIDIIKQGKEEGKDVQFLTNREESEALLFNQEKEYRPFWFEIYTQNDKVYYILYESVID